MIRFCKLCGNPLIPPQKLFCSRECLNKYNSLEKVIPWTKRDPVERICGICGSLFSTKNPVQERCFECIEYNRHHCAKCGAVIEGTVSLCKDCGGHGPRTNTAMCRILTDHATTLSDDHERLSSDFILKICRERPKVTNR